MSSSHRDWADAEKWNLASNHYSEITGRCTRHATKTTVQLVNTRSPFTKDSYIIDVGTGGGSLILDIKDICLEAPVLATDISLGMLEQVDRLSLPFVVSKSVDAVKLDGLSDGSFTHALSSFAIQFTADCMSAVQSMYRVLAPNGTAGIAIWGAGTDPEVIFASAARRLLPDYTAISAVMSNAWSDKESHRSAMLQAGFQQVIVETIQMPFFFSNATAYTDYWFGYNNPVTKRFISDFVEQGGDKEKLRQEMEQIIRKDYGDGSSIYFTGVIGIGTKPDTS